MRILSFEQLKSLFSGVASFGEENGWLTLCRYTNAQMAYYRQTSDRSFLRAGASAGMMLDFRTDTTRLCFRANGTRASSQQLGFLDVYVDGRLRFHDGTADSDAYDLSVDLALPAGEKRVTVYFPTLFSSRIRDVRLDDGACAQKAKKDKKFLFFGDSITQGYVSAFPSLCYPALLSRRFQAEMLNQAIGGECFDPNHLRDTPAFTPDAVFVAYGTNDWSNGKDLRACATAYFDKLTALYPHTRVYTVLPIWRTDVAAQNASLPVTFEQARNTIRTVCAGYDTVTVFDGIDYVPHFPAFYFDHVHPNELGYSHYAAALTGDLAAALPS